MYVPKDARRLYRYKDAKAIEKLYYIHTCFMHDRTYFEAFHAKFTELFGDELLAMIQAAQNAPQDDQLVDIMAQKTQLVNDIMANIQLAFYKMRYFMEEAFKNKLHVLNEFGVNDYGRVRNSQSELQEFMATLVTASNKYAIELIAAGYSQDNIDKLQVLYDDLVAANNDQEYYKGERRALNQQRVNLINEAWKVVQDICRAGKIIFIDDYAKYKQYVLYEGSGGSSSNTYSGSVLPDGTVVILAEGIEPDTALILQNKGQSTLKFCLEDDENPCTSGTEVNPATEIVTTGVELGEGTILKVTNLSDTVEGMYEVEVG